MSIFKIRGTHVKPTFFETLYFYVSKKSVPTNFFKSIFFMGTSIGLNLLNFFHFFAFKTKKFHFTPKNRARTAKLSVPIDTAVKNTFGEAVRHSSKLFVVKKGDKNLSD